MATLDKTDFVSYTLTAEEKKVAKQFTDLQLMYLQTKLCEVATMKINLSPVGMSQQEFIDEHIKLTAQIDTLRSLLY